MWLWSAVNWASFYIPVIWSPQPVTGSIGKKQASPGRGGSCQRYKNICILPTTDRLAVCVREQRRHPAKQAHVLLNPTQMSLSSCDLNSKLGAERSWSVPPVPCSLERWGSSLPFMETGEEQDVIAQQLPPIASSSRDQMSQDELGDPSSNAAGNRNAEWHVGSQQQYAKFAQVIARKSLSFGTLVNLHSGPNWAYSCLSWSVLFSSSLSGHVPALVPQASGAPTSLALPSHAQHNLPPSPLPPGKTHLFDPPVSPESVQSPRLIKMLWCWWQGYLYFILKWERLF